MWLPDAGSLHTVVLLTPGKCAARWICLRAMNGLPRGSAVSYRCNTVRPVVFPPGVVADDGGPDPAGHRLPALQA
ncbi:hypothetical protein GCM10009772_16610 [Pseudonocardia alni subsp. carboxydivorans]